MIKSVELFSDYKNAILAIQNHTNCPAKKLTEKSEFEVKHF